MAHYNLPFEAIEHYTVNRAQCPNCNAGFRVMEDYDCMEEGDWAYGTCPNCGAPLKVGYCVIRQYESCMCGEGEFERATGRKITGYTCVCAPGPCTGCGRCARIHVL